MTTGFPLIIKSMFDNPEKFIWVGLCVLFGLGFLVAGFFWFRWEEEVKSWPSASGLMCDCSIRPYDTEDDTPDLYVLDYLYEYRIDNKTFRNHEYSASDEGPYRYNEAQVLLARHSEGTEVVVYYNPKNPQNSYIHQSDSSSGADMMLGGLAWFGFGLVLFIAFIVYNFIVKLAEKHRKGAL
ncbi:MAG: DUF3592 domain-containing protein [Spirochaetales bacterium]|nr:DUF3592 domain-containing protein [Spirochaetales bacterium]